MQFDTSSIKLKLESFLNKADKLDFLDHLINEFSYKKIDFKTFNKHELKEIKKETEEDYKKYKTALRNGKLIYWDTNERDKIIADKFGIENVELLKRRLELDVDIRWLKGKIEYLKLLKKGIENKVDIEEKNHFCEKMPLSIPRDHFKKFIENKSKNGKPFLTPDQYNSFIERAFLGKDDIRKQKFNQVPKGEKILIQAEFYDFYDFHCFEYFSTLQCQDKFIRLLTENFIGWDFNNVKDNFKPKSKRRI